MLELGLGKFFDLVEEHFGRRALILLLAVVYLAILAFGTQAIWTIVRGVYQAVSGTGLLAITTRISQEFGPMLLAFSTLLAAWVLFSFLNLWIMERRTARRFREADEQFKKTEEQFNKAVALRAELQTLHDELLDAQDKAERACAQATEAEATAKTLKDGK